MSNHWSLTPVKVVFPRPVAGAVTDIVVATRLFAACTYTTTSVGAEIACDATPNPFTGVELVSRVLGLPNGLGVPAVTAQCMSIPVDVALLSRGAVLVNRAGRVGMVCVPGRIAQPAGRTYALTVADPPQWVAGWWPNTVRTTMRTGNYVWN